ncbi:hypothetical protein QBA54_14495 [Streptomyces sp. B21-108]|uniref:hypothetical protein n=1 Tax=Streptomyces sp. B21-108 TaxID=3039419 RepID=UPI002FF05172
MPPEVFVDIAGKRPLNEILESILAGVAGPHVAKYDQIQRTEYFRSLLYSRQVVVNRATFWNSPLLISSTLGRDRDALIKLIADEIITPFLFREAEFDERPRFDVLSKGEDAAKSIASDPSLSEMRCVRLGGADSGENNRKTAEMAVAFRSQISDPLLHDDPSSKFIDISRILLNSGGTDSRRVEALASELHGLAEWTRDKRPDRNDVYKYCITMGDDPAIGLYRSDGRRRWWPWRKNGQFTFELKKWVDVIYNSNLPRYLGSLTFTPQGFPTPLDLGLSWALTFRERVEPLAAPAEPVLEDILCHARERATWRAWDSIQQNANLAIPSPHELTHADIVAIREWPEWTAMMDSLEANMDQPLNVEVVVDFQAAYDAFLQRMSQWWLTKRAVVRERYASGVAKVYRIANWVIGVVRVGNAVFPILPPFGMALPPLPPGDAVKVTVETGLYLFDSGRVNRRRTQLVGGMQTTQTVTREHLLQTERTLRDLYPALERTNYPGRDQYQPLATEESCSGG